MARHSLTETHLEAVTEGPARPKRAGQSLALRPMIRAERIALFEREVRERLSRAALDVLMARAEVISEGQRTQRPGHDGYLGSTMLTIDLTAFSSVMREPGDAGTAQRLATLLRSDPSIKLRMETLAGREVFRVTGSRPTAVRTETSIRAQGARIFIDSDVEATF